jgi:hypothetical protein
MQAGLEVRRGETGCVFELESRRLCMGMIAAHDLYLRPAAMPFRRSCGGINTEVKTVVTLAEVRTVETHGGNVRYVARDADGNEYTTFREQIGGTR